MKKFIAGVIIGVVVILAFLYFGGPRYMKVFGAKTEEAGGRLEKYEQGLKKTAETVKEKAGEAGKAVGDAADKTAEGTKKAYRKTAEKVKEYTD